MRNDQRHLLSMLVQAVEGDNAIDARYHRNDQQPPICQEWCGIVNVKCCYAASRSPYPISSALGQVVTNHDIYRQEHTECELNDPRGLALSWAWCHGNVVRVKDDGNLSKDARNGAVNGLIYPHVEFDFDVAKDITVPPGLRVGRVPYNCVDETLDI